MPNDFGEALARLGLDERSLGRGWHVPNAPAVTNRRFLEIAAEIAGVEPFSQTLGKTMMRIGGLFVPAARELPGVLMVMCSASRSVGDTSSCSDKNKAHQKCINSEQRPCHRGGSCGHDNFGAVTSDRIQCEKQDQR